MSRLEQDAKPILTPLIRGEQAVLSVDDQRLISYWAAKTAAVGDLAMSNGAPLLPSELLRTLRTVQAPWPATVTLAARYEGDRFPLRVGGLVDQELDVSVSGGPRQPWRTFLMSVSVGRLVLQVWGHGLVNVTDLQPRNWKASYASVLWPQTSPTTWPPALSLSDDGLEAFVRAH